MHKYLTISYGVLLLVGAVMFVFGLPFAAYIFTAGSLIAIVQSFVFAIQNRSDELAVARRHRLYFIASLFLGVASWFMLTGSANWVVMALVWVVVVLYLSFRK
ncbi:MAG: hypothetical protein IJS05_04950 [Paludibacteraceae bacterium]|nr:hypothetical protein [Paludibacteraceae bacterium]